MGAVLYSTNLGNKVIILGLDDNFMAYEYYSWHSHVMKDDNLSYRFDRASFLK